MGFLCFMEATNSSRMDRVAMGIGFRVKGLPFYDYVLGNSLGKSSGK